MRRRRAVVVMAALLLAGCGSGGAPSAEPAPDLDPAAFSGSATTVDGDRVELAGYADRDLVVWFWAPW